MYGMLKRMLEEGMLTGTREKLDTFYAFGRVSKDKYESLCNLLQQRSLEETI